MRSSIGQLKDFKNSNVWKDITDELGVWLNEVHGMMENHGMEFDSRKLDRLGGSAEAIRNFGDMVDVLVGLAEDHKAARETATILKKSIKGR